jgi:hypothetical protein
MPLHPLNCGCAKISTPRSVSQPRAISGSGGGREIPRTADAFRTVLESGLAQEEMENLPHRGAMIAHQRTPVEPFSSVPPGLMTEQTRAMTRRLELVIAGVEPRVPWDLHHDAEHL